jgi:predicted XRE-type DNA-binding protein
MGAGPKIAELRAKGEMLRKEGSGEANLIQVEVNQSAEYQREVARLVATNPKLTDEAKGKLEKANKLKVDNLTTMRGLTVEVALKFFSGDIGGTVESGGLINRYYNNSCNVAVRQLELSKQIGVPQPAVNNAELAKSNL